MMSGTIIFHSNGGHGAPSSKTCTSYDSDYECSMTLPAGIPTRDGYVFIGWAQDRQGYPEYQPNQVVYIDREVEELYAIWSPINELAFNLNGGVGELESQYCYFNPFSGSDDTTSVPASTKGIYPVDEMPMPPCHVTIPENEPTRDGYMFVGWSQIKITDEMIQMLIDEMKQHPEMVDEMVYDLSRSKGGSSLYAGGSIIWLGDYRYLPIGPISADWGVDNTYTLHAVWFPTNTLTFDLNGGEGDFPAQDCSIVKMEKVRLWSGLYGEVLEDEEELYDYYDNQGYYPGQIALIYPGDFYFYMPRSVSLTCDIAIPRTAPTREGYKFLGWAEKETVDEPEYNPSDVITLDDDKTLYAIWAPVYTLSYDLNGGYGDIAPRVCEFDTAGGASCEVEVTNARPIRDDYFFLGWADYAEADDDRYQAGELITLTGSKVLYAVWAPIYTLRFDANGGLANSEVLSCHSTTTASAPCDIMIPNTMPIREGYDFLGWSENQAATEAQYLPGDTITFGRRNAATLRRILLVDTRATNEIGSKILYAIWGEKMPVPDAGGDEPEPTPTPTPKPDGTPSKPDTGRMTEEDNHSNIINTIAIFILVPSILALSGYAFKRYNDKKKAFFDNNR